MSFIHIHTGLKNCDTMLVYLPQSYQIDFCSFRCMITTRPMALTHCFKLEVFFTLIFAVLLFISGHVIISHAHFSG